jgi:hypothetical protein
MNKIITLTKRNGDKVYLNTTNIVEHKMQKVKQILYTKLKLLLKK